MSSPGGSEYGEIRVVEVDAGRETGDRIERTRWDAGWWLEDNVSFAYSRFTIPGPDEPATERLRGVRVYRHVIGEPTENDQPILGHDTQPDMAYDDRLLPMLDVPLGAGFVVGRVSTGVSPNAMFFLAPADRMDEQPVPWSKVADLEDEVCDIAVHGDHLYLLTFNGAPRRKIVRTSVSSPDLATAETVLPETAAVLHSLQAARDALYVESTESGVARVQRIDYQTNTLRPVGLPSPGSSLSLLVADGLNDGALLAMNAWTRSPAILHYDPTERATRDTGILPPRPVDMSDIEVRRVMVPSHDDAPIPLVILSKRGLALDGTNPTLLSGYGAYGASYTTPFFLSELLPWFEQGGVYARAGARGGGEFGEDWHRAGWQATKPNTWKDFIACAEHLIEQGYTSPEHLAGEGGSAGGILIGNAIAERPELFGAAVIIVGLTNTLRMETTANGVPNIPEFGSTETEAGFRALLAMDAYHKIHPGAVYPSVLLAHGVNDPRVDVWFSAKLAARLQAVKADGQSVLLRIDYDAGHGIGSTRTQRNALRADIFAFLLDQIGRRA